jgi:hypothetical protein
MSASEIARTYPRPGMLLAEASRAGVVPESTGDLQRLEKVGLGSGEGDARLSLLEGELFHV